VGQRRTDRRLQGGLTAALRTARTALDAIASIVLAPSCAVCDTLLDHPIGGPVCEGCWQSILPLTPPLCHRCGDPLPSWRIHSAVQRVCPRCRRTRRAVDRAAAIGSYDGTLRGIVHAFKYEGRRSLAAPLAALMRERCGALIDGADCVVPVPLHPSKRRRRGFNQAADLANRLPLPRVDALARTRATSTQTDLPAAQRHRNVSGAFAATRRAAVMRGAVVLLVDDVSTTGATLNACATVLKAAGALEVRAITAARVVARLR
jgi:ComF family protein